MTNINRKLYSAPGRRNVVLVEEPAPSPGRGEALVRQRLTLLYPGYDLAWVERSELDGGTYALGCISIGCVEHSDSGVAGPQPGELVLWNGPHADYAILNPMKHVWHLLKHADERLLLAGIGAEASCGLRRALGDGVLPGRAVVIGQGMLGHLAGQWLRFAGSEVTVVENSPKRLEFSKYQGLTRRIDTHNLDWKKKLAVLNEGGVELIVDAAGRAGTLIETLDAAREEATLVLLGPWRPGLDPAALADNVRERIEAMRIVVHGPEPWFGCDSEHAAGLAEWAGWIAMGRMPVERLITTRTPAVGAALDAKRLATGVKSMCGVVIDWTAG